MLAHRGYTRDRANWIGVYVYTGLDFIQAERRQSEKYL